MEGQAERWPFTFAAITTANNPDADAPLVPAGPGRPPKQRVVPWVQVTGFRSHLAVVLPRLLYNEGLMGQAAAVLGGHLEGARQLWLKQRLQLFTAANVRQLLLHRQDEQQQQRQQHSSLQLQNAEVNGSSNSSRRVVLAVCPDPCYDTGFGFAVFCGLSPSQVEALAAADPFQAWDLAYAGRRSVAAADAWQQRWEDYSIPMLQWQQQVRPLRQQQQQQQSTSYHHGACQNGGVAVANAGITHSTCDNAKQQEGTAAPAKGRVLVVLEQQHSEVQQQLLLLPPSRTALSNGKALRARRLLLLVDDVAAGSSASCSSSRGKSLRQQHVVWTDADRKLLLKLQQQQQQQPDNSSGAAAVQRLLAEGNGNAAAGLTGNSTPDGAAADGADTSSWSSAVRELGQLLPPLVCSAKRRLLNATQLLRSVWGALIPPVLCPPVALVCSSTGLRAQQAALAAAPW